MCKHKDKCNLINDFGKLTIVVSSEINPESNPIIQICYTNVKINSLKLAIAKN